MLMFEHALGEGSGWRIVLQEPLAQLHIEIGFQRSKGGTGLNSSNDVEPVVIATVEERALPVDQGLGSEGQPEVRRIGTKRVAEETGRRDTGDGERRAID